MAENAAQPPAQSEWPVTLRHKDARQRAWLYGIFAVAAAAPIVFAFIDNTPTKWWRLFLLVMVAAAGYASLRMATLRVRLDDQGLWQPDPFRLTHVTPWEDIRKVRRISTEGRARFVGVGLVMKDGEKREVTALKTQAGTSAADAAVDAWVARIDAARVAHRKGVSD